jgi:hypothetical protein
MKLLNKKFDEETIAKMEKHYGAKYVIDSCLQHKDGRYNNDRAIIFYTEKKHPNGSHYMAFFKKYDMMANTSDWMITNGETGVTGEFNGLLLEDGSLMHSAYRHDYFSHGNAFVDGGRDYMKRPLNGDFKVVSFKIEDGKIIIIE